MIHLPENYDAKQIERLSGQLRLALPLQFRGELDQAVDNWLPQVPAKARQELKNLVMGSVAITLRASNFAPMLEELTQKDRDRAVAQAKTEEFSHREKLKHRYQKEVEAFELVMFNRRADERTLGAAFESFRRHCEHLTDYEETLLMDWAKELCTKAKKLRRRAA